MTFWSENHQVLFASCEYLAGQLWPDREFQHADGAGDKHDGAWHRDRARKWLHRWLDQRMKLGFSEWNAPGYYNEDLPPLLNVADFCRDAEIASMARTVIDLMVFDLARFTCQGNFGVTAGGLPRAQARRMGSIDRRRHRVVVRYSRRLSLAE